MKLIWLTFMDHPAYVISPTADMPGHLTAIWAWLPYHGSVYMVHFKAVITSAIRLRCDYYPTTMYRARLLPFDASKKRTCQFFVIVVSYLNRNCDTRLTAYAIATESSFHRKGPVLPPIERLYSATML